MLKFEELIRWSVRRFDFALKSIGRIAEHFAIRRNLGLMGVETFQFLLVITARVGAKFLDFDRAGFLRIFGAGCARAAPGASFSGFRKGQSRSTCRTELVVVGDQAFIHSFGCCRFAKSRLLFFASVLGSSFFGSRCSWCCRGRWWSCWCLGRCRWRQDRFRYCRRRYHGWWSGFCGWSLYFFFGADQGLCGLGALGAESSHVLLQARRLLGVFGTDQFDFVQAFTDGKTGRGHKT